MSQFNLLNLVFQIINIVMGTFVALIGLLSVGFLSFINVHFGKGFYLFNPWSVNGVIIALYVITFGVLMILYAIFYPPVITGYIMFMCHWLGKGLFYVFVGCLILSNSLLNLIAGTIVIALGIIYIVLGILQIVGVVSGPAPLVAHSVKNEVSEDNVAKD